MSDHVDDLVWDWFHGALDADAEERFDLHVSQCDRCADVVDAEVRMITRAAASVSPMTPPPRDGLLANATTLARFERFGTEVARLTDVSIEKAKEWLSRLEDADVWTETALGDLELFHIDGGPAVSNAVVGFVKVAAGASFPQHTHVGSEHVLVVQGTMRDEHGEDHGPGSVVDRPPGTEHEIHAVGDHALIYLSVVHEGVEIFGMHFGPDSPEL